MGCLPPARGDALEAERARASADKKSFANQGPTVMALAAVAAVRCVTVLRACSLHDSLGTEIVVGAMGRWLQSRKGAADGSSAGGGGGGGSAAGAGGPGVWSSDVDAGVLPAALTALRTLFGQCIDEKLWRDACSILNLTQAVSRVRLIHLLPSLASSRGEGSPSPRGGTAGTQLAVPAAPGT